MSIQLTVEKIQNNDPHGRMTLDCDTMQVGEFIRRLGSFYIDAID